MEYLPLAIFAGFLTLVSPCVLPILPVVLSTSITSGTNRKRPFVIILSLAISIILFTLLLKVSTLLLGVPQQFWNIVSGIIIIGLGLITVFPSWWSEIESRLKLGNSSGNWLDKVQTQESLIRDILTGFVLGPLFTSCSPTYVLIIAVILPTSLSIGLINLFAYTLSLSLGLLAIAWFGQSLVSKLRWSMNPYGKFKRAVGLVLIVIGILIATGLLKNIETILVTNGWLGAVQLESQIK